MTGLSPEYSEYDGTPTNSAWAKKYNQRHDWFFSDAYRTIANIAMESCWCGENPALADIAAKIQRFFIEDRNGVMDGIYEIDGTLVEDHAKHNVGLMALLSMESSNSDTSTWVADGVMENTDWWNLKSGDFNKESSSNSYTENSMISYALRANYNWKNRYLLTATVRWDGSSKFAQGNRSSQKSHLCRASAG